MAKTVNIKVGQGVIRPGAGLVQNQIKPWNATGDFLTLKDLIDRPEYYVRKVAKHFNLKYNKYLHRKDPFQVAHNTTDTIFDTNTAKKAEINTATIELHKKMRGSLHADCSADTKAYLNEYYKNYYKISYLEPNGNEKVSRPVYFSYTAEEIQTIIDQDLVSGNSGWLVSKVGNLDEPRFGPFMLQSKMKGYRSNIYIRPQFQTNTRFMSGYVGGYPGGTEEYATYYINYAKTGIKRHTVMVQSRDPRKDVVVELGATFRIYDLNVGAMVDKHRAVSFKTFEQSEYNKHGFLTTGAFLEAPNQMAIPIKAYKNYFEYTMQIDFDDMLDFTDTTKPLKIVTARQSLNQRRILQKTMNDQGIIPKTLWSNQQRTYNALTAFQYGAPFSFWGHKYDKFNAVSIQNTSLLKSFRIHKGTQGSMYPCKIIELVNNPNLTYMNFDPRAFPNLHKFNISGCNLDFLNMAYIGASGQTDRQKGMFFRERKLHVPPHARCPYYNLVELDVDKDSVFPHGALPYFISNYKLKYVNLNGNRFNQSGVYAALRACIFSRQTYGYFDARNQQFDGDHLSRAVFSTGIYEWPFIGRVKGRYDVYKYNAYREHMIRSEASLSEGDLIQDEDREILKEHFINNMPAHDVHNKVLTAVDLLRSRGWTVHIDTKYEKFRYQDGKGEPKWAWMSFLADAFSGISVESLGGEQEYINYQNAPDNLVKGNYDMDLSLIPKYINEEKYAEWVEGKNLEDFEDTY